MLPSAGGMHRKWKRTENQTKKKSSRISRASSPSPRNATPEEQLALKTLARLNGALEQLGLPTVVPPGERKAPTPRSPATPRSQAGSPTRRRFQTRSRSPLLHLLPRPLPRHRTGICPLGEPAQHRRRLPGAAARRLSPRQRSQSFSHSRRQLAFRTGTHHRTHPNGCTPLPNAFFAPSSTSPKSTLRGQWVEPPKHLIISKGPR